MTPKIEIVYDGECPFCTDFVVVSNIKKNVGSVRLINARDTEAHAVKMLKKQGINLDDGMAIIHEDGSIMYGALAARFITVYGQGKGLRAFFYRLLLRNERVAKCVYPGLVSLRKLFFRMTRRSLINDK